MALVNASATAAREDFGPSRSQTGTLRGYVVPPVHDVTNGTPNQHPRRATSRTSSALKGRQSRVPLAHWRPQAGDGQGTRGQGQGTPSVVVWGGSRGAGFRGRRGRAWMVVDEVLAAGHHWKRQGGHLGSFQGSRVASGNLARAQPGVRQVRWQLQPPPRID